MKPNTNSFHSRPLSDPETLLLTRALLRRTQKLRKKDLARAGAARQAKRFLEELRATGMPFPGAAFEEPPCKECLETSLILAEGSLLEFESYLLAPAMMAAPGVH